MRALRRTLPDTNLASVLIAGGSPVAPACLHVLVALESLRIDEGALLFVSFICCTYRDDLYKREWGRVNDKMPSSKPAAPANDAPAAVAFGRCLLK